jgi:hypothetical protein
VRPPLQDLPAEGRAQVAALLRAAGMLA